MSADLFAEFTSTPSPSQQQPRGQPAPAFSFFDDLNTAPAPVTQPQPQQPITGIQSGNFGKSEASAVDVNDDWGDFEGGSTASKAPPPVKQDSFTFSSPQTSQPTWSSAPAQNDPFAFATAPSSQPAHSVWSTAPAQDDPFSFTTAQPSQASWQKAPVIKAKKSVDPSVLFDAEDDLYDDDDDFGDFEGDDSIPTATAAPAASRGATDLLGELSLSEYTPASREGGVSVTHKARPSREKSPPGSFGSMSQAKPTTTAPVPSTANHEESWDSFDDWEASIPTKPAEKAPSKLKDTKLTTITKTTATPPPILSPVFDDVQPGELPPTNVPPPAVLLTLFPLLFNEAQDKLFKPMAAQPLPMRNKLLSEPATIAYLQGYIMLATVAAHIIAGRKLRWKRDQHLSQGMRIGPASSRATSGMKLSSIDKSENMKEEREASDVVRAWKDQIGRLRHVVSAANQIKMGTLGAVPDLQEAMPVKVLKQGEGGVPAPQPCMMCGLKRDERVGLADQGVEDSFGEFWVEQTSMHRGCRNFWNEHRDRLRQR